MSTLMIDDPGTPVMTRRAWHGAGIQLFAAVWVVLCSAFAAMNELLLPEKYFDDSNHILSLALTATEPDKDSFVTTAWVYRLVGGFEYPSLTALLTLAFFFVVMFRCAPWMEIARFGVLEMGLFCFATVEASIYLAQFSKESLIILVVATLVFAPSKWTGDLLFLGCVCGYAWLIRNYWFIIAVLFVGFRILLRTRRAWLVPIFITVALAGCAVGFTMLMGADLQTIRQGVSESNSLYANTAIQDYIPLAGPAGGAANALVTLGTLIVPLPLLIAGSPVYLAFAVMMSVLWISTLVVVVAGMRRGWFAADSGLSRATSLVLAVLVTQAIFEPDYGSYIKHLAPLLPLLFLVLRARRVHRTKRLPAAVRKEAMS